MDDLPLARDVAKDLAEIVHSSVRQLPRLHSLPLLPRVQTYVLPPSGVSEDRGEAVRLSEAVKEEVLSAILEMPDQADRAALNAIVLFEEDAATPLVQRYDAAAAHLNARSGEVVRKAHEPRLLQGLAEVIYRRQLGWCLRLVAAESAPGVWYRNTLVDWRVDVSAGPGREVWELRQQLVCTAPVAQPVFVFMATWTGNGPRTTDGIEVLSGPRPGDVEADFPHVLMRLRPADQSPIGATAYFFDLGTPKQVNDIVELAFRHTAMDRGPSGQPFVGISTHRRPELRRIRLGVKLPAGSPPPRYYEQVEIDRRSTGYTASGVQTVASGDLAEQDDDGYYIYSATNLRLNGRYEVWWGERNHLVAYP